MPDYKEILTKMVETDADNSRWLFNLLEVLVDKKILNAVDLDYIRYHGKENTRGDRRWED
ncbi:MAG: hypothetical protein IKE94_11070 [Aeriscardovia sp.]|nr:hypothetical protein [Aeriscardovia sp.]